IVVSDLEDRPGRGGILPFELRVLHPRVSLLAELGPETGTICRRRRRSAANGTFGRCWGGRARRGALVRTTFRLCAVRPPRARRSWPAGALGGTWRRGRLGAWCFAAIDLVRGRRASHDRADTLRKDRHANDANVAVLSLAPRVRVAHRGEAEGGH